ncbi:MAG: cobalt chelatase [Burkholderiaceae bacterium]
MGEAQARARHQQKVEELCAAAIRALAGETDLHFRGRRLHRGRRALPLFAPHLHPSLEADDFASFRGAADGLALRVARSDEALHRRLAPADPVERLVFDLLEQIRVEAGPPAGMPGVARNLRHRFEQWSLAFHRSGLTESSRGILLYTVAQICRARVTGEPVLEETEDLLETTRGSIVPVLGHDLAALRRHRDDQAEYARHALSIAHIVGEMIHSADDERGNGQQGDEAEDRTALARFMEPDDAAGDGEIAIAAPGRSRVLEASDDGYRVFTRAYDREVAATELVGRPRLAEYRERLDRRIAAQGVNLARLARELKALLAVPVRDDWNAGQEEGHVDGRRLAQLVASPAERRLFRTERLEPAAQCTVGFLVDCSGSMKQHVESVAMLVDVLARALEMAGAATEVLGFSTGAWNGGRALRDWRRAGQPPHPGRLNEACHIVFKDADTAWRRARPAIAALLEPVLFREGVDGEAVDWACARLRGRPDERRLLLVISDGCPMDTATNLANDPHYLDHHLREVVQRHEQAGDVAILGVGVGLDLSPYYGRSQALDLSAPPGNGVFREIVALIGGHARR